MTTLHCLYHVRQRGTTCSDRDVSNGVDHPASKLLVVELLVQ